MRACGFIISRDVVTDGRRRRETRSERPQCGRRARVAVENVSLKLFALHAVDDVEIKSVRMHLVRESRTQGYRVPPVSFLRFFVVRSRLLKARLAGLFL